MAAFHLRSALLAAGLCLLAWAPGARAEEPPPADDPTEGDPEIDVGPVDTAGLTARERPSGPVASRPYLALAVGPVLPLGPTGMSPMAVAELGARLGALGGRLWPHLSVGWAAPGASGTIADDRFPSELEWTLHQRELHLGAGLRLRLAPARARLSAELFGGPQVVFASTRQVSTIGGAPAGEVREQVVAPGLQAGLGAAGRVGPGEVLANLGFSSAALSGVLTGDTRNNGIFITLGYRLVAEGRRRG